MRIHRPNYRQKPTSGVLDWSQPDAQGLTFFCPFWPSESVGTTMVRPMRDLVQGTLAAMNSPKVGALNGMGMESQNGVACRWPASARAQWQLSTFTVGFQFASTGPAAGQGGYLLDCGDEGTDGEGSWYSGWRLSVNNSGLFAYVAGSSYYDTASTVVSTSRTQVASTTPTDSWAWLTVTSTQVALFHPRLGYNDTTAARSGAITYVNTDELGIGAYADSSSGSVVWQTNLIKVQAHQLRIYNRVVSEAEIRQVIAEPWRIIASSGVRKYWFPSASVVFPSLGVSADSTPQAQLQ